MPVGTLATVKGISTEQLARTGAQMVLSNTYHLHLATRRRDRCAGWGPSPVHGLGRPDAHRLRRLPGVQPGEPEQD